MHDLATYRYLVQRAISVTTLSCTSYGQKFRHVVVPFIAG